MSNLADRYLAAKAAVAAVSEIADALRDEILAEVEDGSIVVTSDGQMANVAERETVTYRTKEVLALLRREKLDAGRFVSVKAAELRKLDASLIANLPFTSKFAKVLTFKK